MEMLIFLPQKAAQGTNPAHHCPPVKNLGAPGAPGVPGPPGSTLDGLSGWARAGLGQGLGGLLGTAHAAVSVCEALKTVLFQFF